MLVVQVLFVDDEPAMLRALKRSLNDEDFEVYVAEGGEEALRVLSEQPIDVVVSDMRMPGMDGHQLLQRVKKEYPETIRMVLSGQADQNEIFHLLLDGSAKLCIPKPWKEKALRETIQRLMKIRQNGRL